MADKLRREKEMINNNINAFLKTTTEDYIKYYEGSPTFITYYQADDLASTHDAGLEAVNSLIGKDSPKKYKRIYDVKVYGVDTLDVADQLEAGGLMTGVSGEIIFLPDTVRPYAGDFFMFDTDGMETHLFQITDVQFDRITARKFFRCQFILSKVNTDSIIGNVISEYEVNYDQETGTGAGIIESTESETNEVASDLADTLIDKYTQLFYDEDMDTFLYTNYDTGESYWSPYLQHFLHDTKVLSKNKSEILTEIYIMDINEIDNRSVYSEKLYRRSIFQSIINKKLEVLNSNIFMDIKTTDLKQIRNLPFFMSDLKYNVISPIDPNDETHMAYLNAVNVLFGNNFERFQDVDHNHKVHKLDALHLARIEPFIKNGDIIYECANHELEPTQACMAVENKSNKSVVGDLELYPLTLETIINNPELIEDSELITLIYNYINGEVKGGSELLSQIEGMYFEPSIKNYILLPLVVYILKELY